MPNVQIPNTFKDRNKRKSANTHEQSGANVSTQRHSQENNQYASREQMMARTHDITIVSKSKGGVRTHLRSQNQARRPKKNNDL